MNAIVSEWGCSYAPLCTRSCTRVPKSLYKLLQSCAPIGQNIIKMHPPPIILHHHQRWCLRHHIFFYCKPEASYLTYPSYTEVSYTTLFWNSLYVHGLKWVCYYSNLFLQALVKWCNSDNEDQASCEQTYQRMLTQVRVRRYGVK